MILDIDYDTSRWVYVPREFPWEGYDPQEWAATVAGIAAEDFEYVPLEREILERRLTKLLGYPRQDRLWERFALLGVPDRTLEFVQLVFATTFGDEMTLDDLVLRTGTDATRDPEVADFHGKLGTGRKSVAYLRAPEVGGEITVSVIWAWRAGEHDIILMFDTTNLVQFEAVHAHLDAFAASIDLVDE